MTYMLSRFLKFRPFINLNKLIDARVLIPILIQNYSKAWLRQIYRIIILNILLKIATKSFMYKVLWTRQGQRPEQNSSVFQKCSGMCKLFALAAPRLGQITVTIESFRWIISRWKIDIQKRRTEEIKILKIALAHYQYINRERYENR